MKTAGIDKHTLLNLYTLVSKIRKEEIRIEGLYHEDDILVGLDDIAGATFLKDGLS